MVVIAELPYTIQAESLPVPMAVADINSSSDREYIQSVTCVFTTHKTTVPLLLKATSHILKAAPFEAHIRAVLGIVILVAELIVMTV